MPDIFAVRRTAVSAKPVLCFLLRSFNGRIHHLMRVISSIEHFLSKLLRIAAKNCNLYYCGLARMVSELGHYHDCGSRFYCFTNILLRTLFSIGFKNFTLPAICSKIFLFLFMTLVSVEAHAFYSNLLRNKGFQKHLQYLNIMLHSGTFILNERIDLFKSIFFLYLFFEILNNSSVIDRKADLCCR